MNKLYYYFFMSVSLTFFTGCAPDLHVLNDPSPKPIEKDHIREVTATAYTSTVCQTDSTPYLAAWNNRLRPGVKSIAVSRDLLDLGLTNGTKVRIDGYSHTYKVLDKMNKRWKNKIDIYMGCDIRRARKWGKRKVTIRWAKTEEELEKEIIRQQEENSYNISKYILKSWN
jgi:3D (Asp-Asp-Asp) domain-containing protein